MKFMNVLLIIVKMLPKIEHGKEQFRFNRTISKNFQIYAGFNNSIQSSPLIQKSYRSNLKIGSQPCFNNPYQEMIPDHLFAAQFMAL